VNVSCSDGCATAKCYTTLTDRAVLLMFPLTQDQHHWSDVVGEFEGEQLLIARPDNHWFRDFSLPHLHSTPPLGGSSHRSIAIPFGADKLEWCGYPMVKKMWRNLYSFWHNARTWQRHTDTAWRHRPRLCIASRGKNGGSQDIRLRVAEKFRLSNFFV